MKKNYIEVYKAPSAALIKNRWYWRVIDGHNSKIVSIGGEGYYSAWNAKRAATKQFPGLEVKRV